MTHFAFMVFLFRMRVTCKWVIHLTLFISFQPLRHDGSFRQGGRLYTPLDPADIAMLNMAISGTDTHIAEQLAACKGDLLRAFNFAWLTLNPDVLWLQRKLQINFNTTPILYSQCRQLTQHLDSGL